MWRRIIVALLPCAVFAVMHWFQQRVEYIPFHTKKRGIYYQFSTGNIIVKECSNNISFYFAFKDRLEFSAMVKGMLPQVKVLFAFPLTFGAFLLNKTEELKDPRIIQLPL